MIQQLDVNVEICSYMCVYVYIDSYVCIGICMCMCIYVSVYVYMCIGICMYICEIYEKYTSNYASKYINT